MHHLLSHKKPKVNYKAQPYQHASTSKQVSQSKLKPFPSCTHCGINDHRPDDCRKYTECGICGSYDHATSGHNRVIYVKDGALAESSQLKESLVGLKCDTYGSTLHSSTQPQIIINLNTFKEVKECRLQKPKNLPKRPKVVFGNNSSCITEGYGSINYGGIVFSKVAFVNGMKHNLISISQMCDAKYIIQFDDKQGIIFNSNKEIVQNAPRRNDVYVLDMSSVTSSGACFFAKASESTN
ncbi:hypothetical protein Tco_0726171 [Tanacetum coccineum]|uniref:Uncharacterized protein n=1 Tax=Tanacetum coccineum TaxID=301880 RepID=A0ABQ4YEV9_9ASTR